MTAHSHPIEEAGDWIEWNGGECPVDPETLVDTCKRNGDKCYGFRAGVRIHVGCWDRAWRSRRTDIIAYRIVRP